MAEYTEDTGIYPVMIRMAACLEAELVKSGIPVDHLTLQPGVDPVIEHAGNGKECSEAFVNLITSFPSGNEFPGPDAQATCGTELAYRIEVGIIRCAPQPSGRPPNMKLPTVADQLEATRLHLADMAAGRRAIRCCLTTEGQRRVYALGEFTPYGPLGSVVGGVWSVIVGGVDD